MSASSFAAFTVQFNRFVPIPIFFSGVFGNIFNILIFTRPSLIKNPCSMYFMSSSIANLITLFFGLLTRYLNDGFRIDVISTNLAFCKIRYFLLHGSLVLSSWFTVLAGIDRYCISSFDAHRRQLSNVKNARRLVALTTLIVSALYAQIFGVFTIQQLVSGPYCYAQPGAYRIFYDFFYFATYSFTPPIAMIIVGLATVHNIHRIRRHITPMSTNTTNGNPLTKRDRQMIKMLLIQVIFTVILTLPIAVQKLYSTFTQNEVKGAYQLAAENFIAQLMRQFSFINSSASFYV
jgi:hypothetical protein